MLQSRERSWRPGAGGTNIFGRADSREKPRENDGRSIFHLVDGNYIYLCCCKLLIHSFKFVEPIHLSLGIVQGPFNLKVLGYP